MDENITLSSISWSKKQLIAFIESFQNTNNVKIIDIKNTESKTDEIAISSTQDKPTVILSIVNNAVMIMKRTEMDVK